MAEKVQKFLSLCTFNLYVVVYLKNAFLIWNAVSSHLNMLGYYQLQAPW